MTPDELIARAAAAMTNAYAPYSHCLVGAALLTDTGEVFTGCNVENAAYSPGNCAERTAVFKAVSEGARAFSAIAVVGGRDGQVTGAYPPCGVCRQVLMEFADPQCFTVYVAKPGGYDTYTLGELLPFAFSPAQVR